MDAEHYVERVLRYDEGCALRILLFGETTRSFGPEWLLQSLTFREQKPTYGFQQLKSGPCGVLAACQAHVLREFLFGPSRSVLNTGRLRPDVLEQREAIARSISNILQQASAGSPIYWAGKGEHVIIENPELLPNDGMLEYITLKIFTSGERLQDFLYNIAPQIMETGSGSCVLLLYSLILTKGFESIRQEMDDPGSHLIGDDSYCSQEIVNLFLVGQAVPNVFNDDIILNSGGDDQTTTTHHGIHARSKIGLLSVYEYKEMMKVGNYYKNPVFPIWVIVSETHFSVLFATSRAVLQETTNAFKIYYYDGLQNSDEEQEFTIEPVDEEPGEKDNGLPSVLQCILTKWPNAKVKGKWA